MYDLTGITFLTFIRLDNDERIANLRAMTQFYRKYCINYQHILVEDDETSKVPAHIDIIEDDVYIFTNLMKYVYNKLKKKEEIGYKGLQWGNYHHQISSAHIFNRDNKLVELILKGEANE